MLIGLVVAIALAAVAVALIINLRGGRQPSAAKLAAMSAGTLTLTGVSPARRGRQERQAFVTVSGTVLGPDIAPTEVYGGFVWSLDAPWPQIGQDMPVRYDPRKVDSSWVIAADPQ